jgi:trk system potassium uptake protein TrkH
MSALLAQGEEQSPARRRRLFQPRPHQLLLLGFAVAIAVGTLLLMLPAATSETSWIKEKHGRLRFTDALFTATSAVCVTGLTVVDTGGDLSPFGQAVVLCLFQLGGLGIMTFSTLFLLAMGARVSMASMEAAGEGLGARLASETRGMVKRVVLLTLAVEAAAVAVLFGLFLLHGSEGGSAGSSAWSALFHSVSAFCNAGFGLHSDSLARYRDLWDVNLVMMALIITGGIGFPVLRDLARAAGARLAGVKRPPLALHTKVVLVTTAALLVLGTASFLLTEWGNEGSIASLPVHRRVLAAMFQSTTARTAGFSTVEIGRLLPATLFFIVFLMFVGASPCSTGGGIKTSTLGVLGVLAVSKLRGREEPSAFGRSIQRRAVSRAVTVAILSGLVVILFVWLVLVAERGRLASGEFTLSQVLFETMSAFGTVGLSTGITPELGRASHVLLAALMFVGRLGPLTLVVSVARREGPDKVQYPSEAMLIG